MPKHGIDISYLKQLKNFMEDQVGAGRRFFLVCGGGYTTRQYQAAAQEVMDGSLTDQDLDWIGIYPTWVNAMLIKKIFKSYANETIITDYNNLPELQTLEQYSIVIAGGWKPGWSTDYLAVLLAEQYGAESLVNLSNITHIHESDPRKDPNAMPLETMNWDEVIAIVGDDWEPGMNVPFDPIASHKAAELKLTVKIGNGHDFENIKKMLNDEDFVGTYISSSETGSL